MTPSRPEMFAAALAALPGIGPVSLHGLLVDSNPARAWASVCSGAVGRPGRGQARVQWRDTASATDVEAQWATWSAAGISVTWWGDERYPERLRQDPEPPGVLFFRGRIGILDTPVVAVVGTRRCSPDGRAAAYHLARDLAGDGMCVVSGLALGIDGAAHQGALARSTHPGTPGGTVGVAASGVDVVYPPRHVELWADVAARGAVVSESAPGRPAQAWRFPSRNRVIAGLADVVVVVESHAGGGSMLTADAALARGLPVCVFPGPVAAPSSAGTNQLLVDGATPVRGAADVLDLLGRVGQRDVAPARRRATPVAPARRRPPVGEAQAQLHLPGGADDARSEVARTDGLCGGHLHGAPVTVVPALGGDASHSVDPGGAVPGADAEVVLGAVGWRPTSPARIVARTGLPLDVVAAALDELERTGRACDDGGWWRRRG